MISFLCLSHLLVDPEPHGLDEQLQLSHFPSHWNSVFSSGSLRIACYNSSLAW
jgi:hypothetical protein